jgi:stage II sporulation protein D
MKIIKYFFIFCLCSFAFANQTVLKPSKINVLIEKNVEEALLEARGPYYVFNPQDGLKISSGILEKRFMVRASSMGIKWGQEFPGIHQILLAPRSKETSILVNGIQYKGAIAIYKINNKINIVNIIDVENYLKSFLTTQFKYPLEYEAMAAVAIAARTTAYYQIYKNKDSYWHIDGKTINYQGSSLVIPDSAITNAVNSTHNLILVNSIKENPLPFVALWTEHCGGKTAPFHVIFRKDLNAPKEGIEVLHAALDRKEARWAYSISLEQFKKIFKLNEITSVEVFQDMNSKKVYGIRIKDKKGHKDIDFFTLQKVLSKKYIQSNDLTINMHEGEIHFCGWGKGHGVGLCLYSISAMAQNGDVADKILAKFFKNTSIVNLSISKKN